MSESGMRGRIVKLLKPHHGISVENKVLPGTPDVNYVEGWVELKWLRRWPKNAETHPVKIEHFTPQQRVFLKKRRRAGGRAFVLLQANQTDWLLFKGEDAAAYLGKVSKPELYRHAFRTWHKLNEQELLECLTTVSLN